MKRILLLFALVLLAFPASAAADPPYNVFPPGYYKTGDVVYESFGAVEVPSRGAYLSFFADRTDGSSAEITVIHNQDNSVGVLALEVMPRPGGETITYDEEGDMLTRQAIAQPPACDASETNAWNKNAYGDGTFTKIHSTSMPWLWKIKTSTIPGSLNQSAVIDSVKDAYAAWPSVHNNCGLSDTLDSSELSHTYDGSTTQSVQMDNSGSVDLCTLGQTPNVVAFGDLAGTAGAGTANLAVTCVQGSTLCNPADCSSGATRFNHSADIKFNTGDYSWFAGTVFSNCFGKWVFRAVGTHETGHVYGLDHVSDDSHPNQTMSTFINRTCRQPEYTLGIGDVTGIKTLYDVG